PKVVQQARLTPGERVDIWLSPLPRNRFQHALSSFEASFACDAVPDGTRVTRTLTFQFAPYVRWLLEPRLRHRLPGEVRAELRLAKQHLEQHTPGA
ncbi:MAG: hypothetical protein ACRDQA_00005, partial [Nocardioidaceae bacterium]